MYALLAFRHKCNESSALALQLFPVGSLRHCGISVIFCTLAANGTNKFQLISRCAAGWSHISSHGYLGEKEREKENRS